MAKALIFSQYGEPSDVLSMQTHSISPAHSNLLTLRFLASPINPADINTVQGVYPSKPPFTTALGTKEPAAVPGNEGVAEVLAAGASAVDSATGKKFEKGDWVIMKAPGAGTWRTHTQAPSDMFVRLAEADREGISPLQAGTVSVNPCTAWAMLKGYVGGSAHSGHEVKEGGWFAQNGANSGVGRAAIQLGKAWGLKSLNFVRERPGGEEETRKLKDELKALGADAVYTEQEAAEKGFGSRVKEEALNGGREKVELALNCVGGKSALNLSKVLMDGGWHVTYGAMAKQPVSVPAGLMIFKEQRYTGFWVSQWSKSFVDRKVEAVSEVLRLTRDGKFRDVPVQEIKWDWNTEEKVLKDAVQGTLEGFRGGKGVFVFGEDT